MGKGWEHGGEISNLIHPSSKIQPTASGPCFPLEPWQGARLGSARPGVREGAERGGIPHTHLVLTTITTLGVGPLTSRCTMPNRWLYIFKSPWDGGGVRRGSPTAATSGTSFRDAEVWLPWSASQGYRQVGGAEVGPVTMVTIDAGTHDFLLERRS